MVSQGARGISRLLLLLCCLPVAPAIGGKQVQLLLGPMLLKRNMEGFVTNCLDYKSELMLSKEDGLKDASSRNLDKQRSVLEGRTASMPSSRRCPSANRRPLAACNQP